ncbi:sensor histidine kinase, partial [Streptomyces clavuligerus]
PPPPSLPLQVNALQALCRQVFGFRLAMIALAVPFALAGTAPGPANWLVGAAVLVTFMTSYALLRDWERFGPVLLRHPWLLGADMAFGALLLVTASPDSTLAYVIICTPLLGGLISGRRGGAVLAVLQSALVAGAYAVNDSADARYTALLLPGLCVLTGVLGSTLRTLMLRFGAAGQALSEARARLAAAGAVEDERARLAREMHDSVAKTLHGLALAAEGLARSADRMDPAAVRDRADLVAHAARRAAAESRALLADLRRDTGLGPGAGPVTAETAAGLPVCAVLDGLRSRTEEFSRRTGVRAVFRRTEPAGPACEPLVPPTVARQLLTIVAEALENAHRHGGPGRVEVCAGRPEGDGGGLRVRVHDDGRGLPPGTTLDGLRRKGRFGLVGMAERAASIGARIQVGAGEDGRGTEVRLDLPLPVPGPPARLSPQDPPSWRSQDPSPRSRPGESPDPPPGPPRPSPSSPLSLSSPPSPFSRRLPSSPPSSPSSPCPPPSPGGAGPP